MMIREKILEILSGPSNVKVIKGLIALGLMITASTILMSDNTATPTGDEKPGLDF